MCDFNISEIGTQLLRLTFLCINNDINKVVDGIIINCVWQTTYTYIVRYHYSSTSELMVKVLASHGNKTSCFLSVTMSHLLNFHDSWNQITMIPLILLFPLIPMTTHTH
jgi:hypothetical protein